jgi:hypothetical protein
MASRAARPSAPSTAWNITVVADIGHAVYVALCKYGSFSISVTVKNGPIKRVTLLETWVKIEENCAGVTNRLPIPIVWKGEGDNDAQG